VKTGPVDLEIIGKKLMQAKHIAHQADMPGRLN